MSFLDRLERHFGRLAVPGLPLIIVAAQVVGWMAIKRGLVDPSFFVLVPAWAVHGHPWQFFTFLFMPPSGNLIWIILAWWTFYFLGSALEGFWGVFRFNVFLFVGYMLTVAAAFLYPYAGATSYYLEGSVFLAFAYLNPNFEFLILFILPVRAKWLALLTWLFYAYLVVTAPRPVGLLVLASVVNFFLFFGRELYQNLGLKKRALKQSAARRAAKATQDDARHRCRICGKTDKTNPELDFRYCSQCSGDQCYCPEHIFNHAHVTGGNEANKSG